MATYYIDTNDFATATSIWTNSNLTVKAANGFYQKDGVYRQMSGGELLSVANCPECFFAFGSSLVQSTSSAACSSTITQTYYFDNVDGGVGEMTRGDILIHVCNHKAFHRGHIGDMFYQSGYRPPSIDLPVYIRDAFNESELG
jgi:hypothetical protein